MTSPLQQKIRVTGPVVITANRLSDGVVVYRTANKSWTVKLDEAAVVTTAQAATELLAGIAGEIGSVDPYIAPVIVQDGLVQPGNLREQIRLSGPTFDLPGNPGT